MKVISPDFKDQGLMPVEFTCDGQDLSPRLEWATNPAAKSYALVMEDPDAPGGTFIHWVMYNIHLISLPRGIPASEASTYGLQGMNDFGKVGYGGPCPPKADSAHRYYFHIYALESDLEQIQKCTASLLRGKIRGKVIDDGVIMVKYKRA